MKKGKREILTEKYEKERVNLRVSKDDTREPESGRTRKEIAKKNELSSISRKEI